MGGLGAFQGATLKNKCYAIKRGLLNRSVYLYGNNDRLKTRGSVTCRTGKQICIQVLCLHDSTNDLGKLSYSKKWLGFLFFFSFFVSSVARPIRAETLDPGTDWDWRSRVQSTDMTTRWWTVQSKNRFKISTSPNCNNNTAGALPALDCTWIGRVGRGGQTVTHCPRNLEYQRTPNVQHLTTNQQTPASPGYTTQNRYLKPVFQPVQDAANGIQSKNACWGSSHSPHISPPAQQDLNWIFLWIRGVCYVTERDSTMQRCYVAAFVPLCLPLDCLRRSNVCHLDDIHCTAAKQKNRRNTEENPPTVICYREMLLSITDYWVIVDRSPAIWAFSIVSALPTVKTGTLRSLIRIQRL